MFTVDQVVAQYYPSLHNHTLCEPLFKPILRKLLREKAFLSFGDEYPHLQGFEFIEQVLEYFNFSFDVLDSERENIPYSGRVVIIANHPIGSLDGLALLKMIHEVRSDVRIVANDLLTSITPLHPCLFPVKVMTGVSGKKQLLPIYKALENDEAVIFFPAGEVSRFGLKGIKDGKWHTGFLKIAERAKAPILPIHLRGQNSFFFYLISTFLKPLSTLMLVGQMFHQRKKQLHISIGALIPFESYGRLDILKKEKARLFKKHTYRLESGKKPLFRTTSAIARPERKTDLKKSIRTGKSLGKTPDGKDILLFESGAPTSVMREIGMLREYAFRAVGEGTGNRRDLDPFDSYYHHLILWDDEDLEIVGAYRFVDAQKTIYERGRRGLYSNSLFQFGKKHTFFLESGLELGRSFVQQRYWGKRSLEYLWYGIGKYLNHSKPYRYLFGPVSISSTMPQMARELLIYFYTLYFTGDQSIYCSRNPFRYSHPLSSLAREFTGKDYQSDFKKLKTLLANLGTAVPTLYKQYTELCEPGGVMFLDFNVDPAFNNCVDGLVIVDLTRIKAKKRKRYLEDLPLTTTL